MISAKEALTITRKFNGYDMEAKLAFIEERIRNVASHGEHQVYISCLDDYEVLAVKNELLQYGYAVKAIRFSGPPAIVVKW